MTSRLKAASGSLEEKAVQHLGELIAEGQIKNYEGVVQYIELTKQAQELHCPVCLEPWKNPVKSSSCGHIFCEQCIRVWKMRCKRLRCPLQCPCCRADIQTLQQPVSQEPIAASRNNSNSKNNNNNKNKNNNNNNNNSDRTKRAARGGMLRRQLRLVPGLPAAFITFLMLFLHFYSNRIGDGEVGDGGGRTFSMDEIKESGKFTVLPTLGELKRDNGPGVYAVVNQDVTVYINNEQVKEVYQNGAKVTLKVPTYEVEAFFPQGTILKVANTPDGMNINQTMQTLESARVIEADGTMTEEVISSIPLKFVSYFRSGGTFMTVNSTRKTRIMSFAQSKRATEVPLESPT